MRRLQSLTQFAQAGWGCGSTCRGVSWCTEWWMAGVPLCRTVRENTVRSIAVSTNAQRAGSAQKKLPPWYERSIRHWCYNDWTGSAAIAKEEADVDLCRQNLEATSYDTIFWQRQDKNIFKTIVHIRTVLIFVLLWHLNKPQVTMHGSQIQNEHVYSPKTEYMVKTLIIIIIIIITKYT